MPETGTKTTNKFFIMNYNSISTYITFMIKLDITNQGTFKTLKYYKNLPI